MSVPSRFLRADPSVLDYVLNHQAQDQRLLSCLRFQPPLPWQKAIVESATRDRLQKLLQIGLADEEQESPYTLYLHGRPGVGKKTIAQALCGEVGLELGVADLRILVRMPGDFATHVRLVLREAWLRPCIIYFDHFEILEQLAQEKPELLKTFLEETGSFGWVTVIAGENPLPSSLVRMSRLVAVEIPAPDFATQKQIWGVHLNGTGSQFEEGQLDLLANQFALTGGQIARAASRARKTAFAHDPENGEPAFDDLLAGSRIQSQPKLSTLARKIEPLFHWPDLVLPDDKIAQLQELSDHLKHRQKVMKEWGFHNKLSLGRGITALFAGPSGTGKTMAAEVIANDLALDLYKIDLSSVVSKYIGETEKNLSKIFQEAQHSNAILFFDEADALFGKRSEVKDAHDRHANIEVGYLLQKMEEYEGVVIMATNLAKNMDEAFTRRMRFSIDFPMPTEKYRRRIWGGIWPSETPLGSELDLDMIAREFDFAGGNIRNIALAAAYLAAAEDTTVSMAHLKHATQREYQKMGRMIVPQDFAHFAIDS